MLPDQGRLLENPPAYYICYSYYLATIAVKYGDDVRTYVTVALHSDLKAVQRET